MNPVRAGLMLHVAIFSKLWNKTLSHEKESFPDPTGIVEPHHEFADRVADPQGRSQA